MVFMYILLTSTECLAQANNPESWCKYLGMSQPHRREIYWEPRSRNRKAQRYQGRSLFAYPGRHFGTRHVYDTYSINLYDAPYNIRLNNPIMQ